MNTPASNRRAEQLMGFPLGSVCAADHKVDDCAHPFVSGQLRYACESPAMSAFRGKADMAYCSANVRL